MFKNLLRSHTDYEPVVLQPDSIQAFKKYPPNELHQLIKQTDEKILIDIAVKNISDQFIIDNLPIILQKMKYPIISLVKNKVPVIQIKKIITQLDLTITDEKDQTFLFYIRNIDYLLEFLELENVDLPLHHLNKSGYRFFSLIEDSGANNYLSMTHVINILVEKKYNFELNENIILRRSLIDNLLAFLKIQNSWGYENLVKAVFQNCCLESRSLTWITDLIYFHTKSYQIFSNIMACASNRKDLLYKLVKNYAWHGLDAETHIIIIFNHFYITSMNTYKQLILYTDHFGNNVLHYAAKFHSKQLLRYFAYHPYIEIFPLLNVVNTDLKKPIDLYKDHDIESLL